MNTNDRCPAFCTLMFFLLLASMRCFGADTPSLIVAVKSGDTTSANTLLKSNPALDARDDGGHTALHWAAIHGRDDLVRQLIRRGAIVDATNSVGATPLIYAVGNLKSVRALLDAGADVNRETKWGTSSLVAAARYPESSAVVRLLLRSGADESYFDKALDSAAGVGDLETFEMLLEAGAKPGNVIEASKKGYTSIVKAALDAGADVNFAPGFVGHALNFALYAQQVEIARILIEHGADLTLRSPRGEHQTPPILWAAYNESGDTAAAELMIEKGVDVNMLSALGESALDWARARNNTELEAILLEAGATNGTAVVKQKKIPSRTLPTDANALDELIRDSVGQGISLLQRTSDGYLKSGVVQQQQCVSCHQQTLPAVAFGWARERDLSLDEVSIGRQVQDQVRYWMKDEKVAKTYEMIPPQPDASVLLGYGLTGLSALGYPADTLTEGMVWYLAATQLPDGSWPARDFRPPMEDGPIQGAAFAIRALQLYPIIGREAEFKQRIARAREYLMEARPVSFNQQVFQLLGSGWAGGSKDELKPFVQAILDKQREDGGWSQLEGLPPDAWATGQALVALNTVGGVATTSSPYQRGAQFLLRTQFDDGSWYVRSRAWPFQPHFESGFPHGKDQWISAGGTAWAVMALLLTQPKVTTPPKVDWLAVKVPDYNRGDATEEPAVDLKTSGTRTVEFTREIQPLLERSCVGCHGGKRPKGKFRVDSRQGLLQGGQSGDPAVLIKRPDLSPIVKYMKGEIEDLEMPPLGKRVKYPGLTDDEIKRVEQWIREGAEWPDGEVTLKSLDQ